MITPEGWERIARWQAGEIENGGLLGVTNGTVSAWATVSAVAVSALDGGGFRVAVEAIFAQDQANFEWTARSLKLADGTVIEAEPEDLGRKAEGAEWAIAVRIDFGAPA